MLHGDARLVLVRRFVRDGKGATAIEYALMGMFIAVAIAASVSAIGTQLSAIFAQTSTAF